MKPGPIREWNSAWRARGVFVRRFCPPRFFKIVTLETNPSLVAHNLRYGTTTSKFGRRRYLEDWATLFKLLEEDKIKPVIMKRFPILEAARANALLESGRAIGNIVLLAPELL